MWPLPRLIVAVLIGCWRAIRAVQERITGPTAQARQRLTRGATPIADREVVTVDGTVRAVATALTSPLSGRPCVAYHAVATLYETPSAFRNRMIVATIVETRLAPFELELEVDGAAVMIEGDRAALADPVAPLIPRQLELEQEFVARHGQRAELVRGGGFEEAVIAVGDRIRVQGLALAEAPAPSEQLYRDGAPRFRIVAHPAHPLTIGRLVP